MKSYQKDGKCIFIKQMVDIMGFMFKMTLLRIEILWDYNL